MVYCPVSSLCLYKHLLSELLPSAGVAFYVLIPPSTSLSTIAIPSSQNCILLSRRTTRNACKPTHTNTWLSQKEGRTGRTVRVRDMRSRYGPGHRNSISTSQLDSLLVRHQHVSYDKFTFSINTGMWIDRVLNATRVSFSEKLHYFNALDLDLESNRQTPLLPEAGRDITPMEMKGGSTEGDAWMHRRT